MHSNLISADLTILFFVWYVLHYSHDLCLTGFGGKNIPLNTSKPNSDLTEQLVRSTYVSPQLEANPIIPARQTPFRYGLSRRHVKIAGLAIIAEFLQKPSHLI